MRIASRDESCPRNGPLLGTILTSKACPRNVHTPTYECVHLTEMRPHKSPFMLTNLADCRVSSKLTLTYRVIHIGVTKKPVSPELDTSTIRQKAMNVRMHCENANYNKSFNRSASCDRQPTSKRDPGQCSRVASQIFRTAETHLICVGFSGMQPKPLWLSHGTRNLLKYFS